MAAKRVITQAELDAAMSHSFGQTSYGYSIARRLKMVSFDSPVLVLSVDVTEDMLNGLDAVHGGVHPFLADVCTSIALSAVHPGSSISVSVAMTVEYADAAKLGDTLYIVSKVNKAGGRLAYITYEILCSKTGSDEERRIVATGSHTKYVLKNKM